MKASKKSKVSNLRYNYANLIISSEVLDIIEKDYLTLIDIFILNKDNIKVEYIFAFIGENNYYNIKKGLRF